MTYLRAMNRNIYVHQFSLSILLCVLLSLVSFQVSAQLFPGTSIEQQEESQPEFSEDPLGRNSPRGTVSGFVRAVSQQDYDRASMYLNLDEDQEGERIAQVLQRLLDRGGNILPYSWISDENSGSMDDNLPSGIDRVGTVTADGKALNLLVEETEGPQGSPVWLFASETVETIAAITVEEPLLVEQILPNFLKDNLWGGVPVGQWIAALVLIALAYLLAWCVITFIKFIIPTLWSKARSESTAGIIAALSLPFKLYLAVWFFVFLSREIGISIIVRQWFSGAIIVIGLVAFLILLWRLTDFIGNFSKRKMSLRGNVSGVSVILFLRRAAKVAIVVFGIIAILGTVGIDVTAGLAALGIGGIALALGAQKTMENFVGSVTLIADQPVRVGDFCRVGETIGTIEKIGMRSTRIRTLSRTVVTIPNGQFSSDTIENYAHRDRFFFAPVLDLRYETSPDQIRYLLVELRSILYAHPMVSPDPARVRFVGLGADSIKLEVFSYINAPNYDVFLEVREDLLLRMMDVVAESGTDFAFPSQTIYFARDKGLSKEKGDQAQEKVTQWKEDKDMQIPNFDPDRIENLKNTIPYPPKGSTWDKDQGEILF